MNIFDFIISDKFVKCCSCANAAKWVSTDIYIQDNFPLITSKSIFKNGPSIICGRQPLKNFKWYGML